MPVYPREWKKTPWLLRWGGVPKWRARKPPGSGLYEYFYTERDPELHDDLEDLKGRVAALEEKLDKTGA